MNKNNKEILILKISDNSFKGFVTSNRLKLEYKFTNNFHDSKVKFNEIFSSGTYHNTNNFMNDLFKKIIYKDTLNNKLLWKGINLLQFVPGYTTPYVFFATQLVEILNNILEIYKPKYISYEKKYINEYSFIWNNLIEEYAIKYNIEIINTEEQNIFLKKIVKYSKFFLKQYGIAYLTRHIRRIYTSYKDKNYYFELLNKISLKKKDIIVLVTLGKRYWDGKLLEDYQFSEIVRTITNSRKYNIVVIDIENQPFCNLKKRNKINNEHYQIWVNYNIFIKPLLSIKDFILKFISRFKNFYKFRKSLSEIMFYQQISLFRTLSFILKYCFFDLSFESQEYLISSEELLTFIKPKFLITTHEAAPIPRSLIIAANKLNIPSIGLQHGTISRQHPDYSNACVTTELKDNPFAFVVPKKMAVWGSLWKKNLVKNGNFPEDSVVITGYWRNNLKEKIYNEMPLLENNNHKFVGIISSVWHSYSEIYLRTILDELNNINSFKIYPVIKFHPAEEKQNILKIKKIVKEYGYSEKHICFGQITDVLNKSNLIISEYSTALLESVLFKIPTILFNINKFKNYPNYFEDYNVVKIVNNDIDLRKEVINLLSNEYNNENRDKFLNDIFNNFESNASQKIMDLLV